MSLLTFKSKDHFGTSKLISGRNSLREIFLTGSTSFFLQQGFGNIDGEYWLGLENIYWLTNQGTYKLLVTMEDWAGRKTFAEYASFRVEAESDFYRLRVGRYHGNAGDSLTWHNGKQFTTLDRDHDVYAGESINKKCWQLCW